MKYLYIFITMVFLLACGTMPAVVKMETDTIPPKPQASAEPADVTEPIRYTVIAEKLYFRTGAGTGFPEIGVLEYGTIVVWTGVQETPNNDAWYQVTYEGQTGWVNSTFITAIP